MRIDDEPETDHERRAVALARAARARGIEPVPLDEVLREFDSTLDAPDGDRRRAMTAKEKLRVRVEGLTEQDAEATLDFIASRGREDFALWYDPVILLGVKTAISVPDETFHRVDHAAKRLGVSRSEFFSRAAEKALDALDDDGTTEAINRVIAGLPADHAFTDAAAAALAAGDQR